MTRRGFLGSVAATGAVAGCRTFSLAGGDRALLRIGVVSDVHVRLAQGGEALEEGFGTETFEKSLEYFRDNGVDAVVRIGQLVNVYEDRIEFYRREFASGIDIGEPWIVELPARPRSFAVRAKEAHPAQFPRPVSATVPLAALPAGASSVEVTPLDSFGNRGRPLVTAIARNERAVK